MTGSRGRTISIVTNAPISQNPRVVKEADALSDAGFDVTVFWVSHAAWTRALDDAIVRTSAWRARALDARDVGLMPRALRYRTALRSRVARVCSRLTAREPVPEMAYSRFFTEQLRLLHDGAADLYIGHNPQSLPVVACAARRAGTRYAFDAEDLHSGEFDAAAMRSDSYRLVCQMEGRYLPGCAHVTAAAPGIARKMAQRYRIAEPTTILNVFPWADRARLDGAVSDRIGRPAGVSFYWYSQIAGQNRGLQEAIAALGEVPEEAELHIRGALSAPDREVLERVATESGVRQRVHFHPPVAPEALLSRAAEHDVGLALEVPTTENRDVCLTNKLFLYMLAGLAVIASSTTGQQELLREAPEAGALYPSGSVDALAGHMRRVVADRGLLRRMRAAALAAARDRWNWEIEMRALIATVEQSLGAGSGRPVRPRPVNALSETDHPGALCRS